MEIKRKLEVEILVSEKIDFKIKMIKRDIKNDTT